MDSGAKLIELMATVREDLGSILEKNLSINYVEHVVNQWYEHRPASLKIGGPCVCFQTGVGLFLQLFLESRLISDECYIESSSCCRVV